MLGPGEFCAREDCPAYEAHDWIPELKTMKTDPVEVLVETPVFTIKPKIFKED